MTCGGDAFLCGESGGADRAVLAFGEACFGTGGSNGGVDYFGVTQRFDAFLCGESGGADRAVLAFGKTAFGTGGRNGGVDYFGVTQCFDALRLLFAASANAFLFTGFGAGGVFYGDPRAKRMDVCLGFGRGCAVGHG